MSLTALVGVALLAFATSVALTDRFVRWAQHARVLDVPNHRSGHATPTPRGAGVVIAGVTVVAGLVTLPLAPGTWPFLMALAGAVPIVLVGWLDDRRGLHPGPRLAVHALASAWGAGWLVHAVWHLNGPPAVVATLVLTFVVAWFVNLFNFMDGLDGLAAGQAAIAALALAVLAGLASPGTVAVLGVVVAATLGYLRYNWPPARVFMGDSGSTFLGYALPVGALWVAHGSARLGVAAFLPLMPFLLDATATLLLRVSRRERWWRAHRDHAYQRRVDGGAPILAVDLVYWLWATVGLGVGLAVARLPGSAVQAVLPVAYVAASATGWVLLRRVNAFGPQDEIAANESID